MNRKFNQVVKNFLQSEQMKQKDLIKESNTEEIILAAAHQVFMKNGYAGTKMQEIADTAGINKALLHYYFRSKEKLFEKIIFSTFKDFMPIIVELLNSEKPLEVKIWVFVEKYIDLMVANPYLPLFVMNIFNHQPELVEKLFVNQIRPSFEIMQKQIDEQVKLGAIIDVKAEHLIVSMLSLSIFQFLAKPFLNIMFNIKDEKFLEFVEERKSFIPKLIFDGIKVRS